MRVEINTLKEVDWDNIVIRFGTSDIEKQAFKHLSKICKKFEKLINDVHNRINLIQEKNY